MWSDKDIDNAFQRLNPPDPDPTPFPLDAWLRLESQLDKVEIERTVRRKMWRFFAAEVAVVAVVALGWLLWPGSPATPAQAVATATEQSAIIAGPRSGSAVPEAGSLREERAADTKALAAKSADLNSVPAGQAASAKDAATAQGATIAASTATLSTAAGTSTKGSPLLATVTPDAPRKQARSRTALPENRASTSSRALALIPSRNNASQPIRENSAYAARNAGSSRPSATVSASVADKAAARSAAHTAQPGLRSGDARRARQQSAGAGVLALKTTTPKSAARSAGEAPVATALAATETAFLEPRTVGLEGSAAPALPAPLATRGIAETMPVKAELPARQPRFYIGLVGAPDVSTVKFASVESPLLNAGITLEYRLTDRLRVSTGVLRSTKQYLAHRDDYDWGAYRDLVYKHDFEYVEGTCTVLDIPLNLRYDVLARPQYKLFGSAGLSSYFMQHEYYYYDYVDYGKKNTWEGRADNINHHLFSVLNLSVGYERSLSSRWSVQAEPYFKLPLGGVGQGKVRLTSAGVFMGVKYGF